MTLGTDQLDAWGRAPEQCNKYPCDCDLLGNDGLTHAERREYADRYARGPGRGLTPTEGRAVRAFLKRKRAERKEAN